MNARPIGLEARCSRCGETFIPADELDLEAIAAEGRAWAEANPAESAALRARLSTVIDRALERAEGGSR